MAIGSVHNAYPNGRPSGLPTDIVDQLVQARQQQRIQPIKDKIEGLEEKKDLYTSLNDTLREAYKAADQIDSKDGFQQYDAGTQNESVASAEATGSPKPGSYDLDVSQVAQAHHQLLGVEDPDTGDLSGISDPDDPALLGAGTEISFSHQGQEYSYSVEEDTSLSDLANSIDEDDNGVTAGVSKLDESNYVLSLKSESTGTGDNRITRDEAGEEPGVNIDATGADEGSLFLDPDGNALTDAEIEAEAGQDAQFSVDGAQMTRSDNQIDDAIDGLSLDLQGTGQTKLEVAQDREGVAAQVEGFVEAYNQFKGFLDEQASYNKEEDKAGPLMGDRLARNAQNRLRGIINGPVAGTGDDPYQYISQVGVEFQKDGTLSFDQEKFDEALAQNPDAVEKLFASEDGVGKKLSNLLQEYTSSGGSIDNSISNLNNRMDRLEDKQEREFQRLESYQERQVRTFTNLEQAVQKYQSTEDELNSIVDSWDSD